MHGHNTSSLEVLLSVFRLPWLPAAIVLKSDIPFLAHPCVGTLCPTCCSKEIQTNSWQMRSESCWDSSGGGSYSVSTGTLAASIASPRYGSWGEGSFMICKRRSDFFWTLKLRWFWGNLCAAFLPWLFHWLLVPSEYHGPF